jgi:hypothetical protein
MALLKHRAYQENLHAPEPVLFMLDALSKLSAASPSTNSASDSEATSSSLGSQSSSESWMSDSETSNSELQDDEDMLVLLSVGDDGWDSDEDEGGGGISDFDADDEESDEEVVVRPSPRQWVQTRIEEMYAHRYEEPRDRLPRGLGYMHHVLTVQKDFRPDHFRQSL